MDDPQSHIRPQKPLAKIYLLHVNFQAKLQIV